jgi:hypothetical protein
MELKQDLAIGYFNLSADVKLELWEIAAERRQLEIDLRRNVRRATLSLE